MEDYFQLMIAVFAYEITKPVEYIFYLKLYLGKCV